LATEPSRLFCPLHTLYYSSSTYFEEKIMRRKIAAALVTLPSALLVTAAPALAASSDGTVHYSTPQTCYDYPGYGTFCISSSGQSNTTTTPSGNYNAVGKGTYSYSFTSGSYPSYSSSTDYQYHYLFKQGEPQVSSGKVSDSFTCNGQTCTYSDVYHYANGKTQFHRPEFSCT
jgi:hypothetical protein